MIREMALCAFAAAGSIWATSDVNAATIDFSDLGNAPYSLGNGSVVSQAFGDTAAVDISYASLDGGSNWGQFASVYSGNVRYWNGNYSGDQAVYADTNGKKVQVKLEAASGQKITSISFDFGAYSNTNRSMDFRVYDGLWNQLGGASSFFLTGAIGGGGILSYVQDLSSIVFQFGDDWNVGLNSISFETASTGNPDPVPVPAGIVFAGPHFWALQAPDA